MEEQLSNFERETSIAPVGRGSYRTHLSAEWNIGDNPNGGYAQLAALRAMGADLGRPDPLTVTTHFLRPAVADADGEIEVAEVRAGRRSATATATLRQAGRERVRMLAAFGDLTAPAEWDAAHELVPPPVELLPAEECPSRTDLEQGIELRILSRVDVRIDPRWERADPSRAEIGGWIRFADDGPVDTLALALFADAFPPSIFSLHGRIGWVPTLELTVHVRRRPVPGWIRGRFRTEDLTGGFLVEDGELWDASGALVARSRQLAVFAPDES